MSGTHGTLFPCTTPADQVQSFLDMITALGTKSISVCPYSEVLLGYCCSKNAVIGFQFLCPQVKIVCSKSALRWRAHYTVLSLQQLHCPLVLTASAFTSRRHRKSVTTGSVLPMPSFCHCYRRCSNSSVCVSQEFTACIPGC